MSKAFKSLLDSLNELEPDDLTSIQEQIDALERQLDTLRAVQKIAMQRLGVEPAKPKKQYRQAAGASGAATPTVARQPVVEDDDDDEPDGSLPPVPPLKPALAGLGPSPIDGQRFIVAEYLCKSGGRTRGQIMKDCKVGPKFIGPLLNHPWFKQNDNVVYITPEGRQAADPD